MNAKVNVALFLLTAVLLQGCASNTSQSPQPASASYSPVTTNQSYMFRSPPPAAVSAIRGR